MGKIQTATQAQWDAVEACRVRWLTDEQTAQYPVEAIRRAVWKRLDAIKHPRVPVWVVDSPLIARIIAAGLDGVPRANLDANLYDNLRDNLYDNLYDNLRANLDANLSDNLYVNLDANLRDNLYVNLDANLRDNLRANLADNLRANLVANLYDNLYANLRANLRANLDDNLRANLVANLRANLADNLRANLRANLDANLYANNMKFYCGLWWNARAAWFEAGGILGVPEHHALGEFIEWNRLCPVWMWSDTQLFILRRPTEIHWQSSDGVLHNEKGPSVLYSPSFSLWHIEGVPVDRQIVLAPETQTVSQIDDEQNEEVRRIRIERFGVMRYLEESSATVIDSRRNTVENTYEILANTKHGQRLVTHCPSTGRRYFLSIPDRVETCDQAQRSLWGNVTCNIIGRT